ncbi:MAG: hypothetical protein JOY59_05235, partial [Candidatus Eremiobacteraeota bacterium]|nr:hypothetical protein [Candidatus Eremiobacteraeota bacterium]
MLSRAGVRRAAFSQAALVLALFPLRSSAQAPGIPALLQRAIAVYQAEVHGIIGMQRHFSTVIDAGIAKHGEESESGFLMNDGAFVKIKYYKVEDDGKAFSAEKIAERENETNR